MAKAPEKVTTKEEPAVEGKVPAITEDKGVMKPADVVEMGAPALPKDYNPKPYEPSCIVTHS